jgi:Zn-dependent protease with chaperone function
MTEFMAQPTGWGLAVAAGELAIGTAILAGGSWTRRGLLTAIAFHLALMLFGWWVWVWVWVWVWSVPMLVLLVALWREETSQAARPPHRYERARPA